MESRLWLMVRVVVRIVLVGCKSHPGGCSYLTTLHLLTPSSCSEVGHLARECPQKPEGFGKCFNCGEEGYDRGTNL